MKRAESLVSKINTYFIVLITLYLSLFGVYNYLSLKAELSNALQLQVTNIIERMGKSITKAIWNVDFESYQKITNAEITAKELSAIVIYDQNDSLLVGRTKNNTGQIQEIANESLIKKSNYSFTKTKNITYTTEGKTKDIGKIILFVTDQHIKTQLTNSIIKQIIQIGILDSILIIIQLSILTSLIKKPLNNINFALADIAQGKGDLRKRLTIKTKDELGTIAITVNQFVESLQNIIIKIKTCCTDLLATAETTSTNSVNIRDNIEQQRAEMTTLASSVNELSSTAQEIAQNADLAKQSVQNTRNESISGKDIVTKTETNIHSLAANIQSASTVIDNLAAQVKKIGAIVDVIQGIAEQTNLLALNAAIEAARAGEQGRGFAVVADEVRTLAQRTQQSTEEIHSMITQLQTGSQKAVQVMEQSLSQTKSSVEYATEAGLSLEKITSSIEEIANMSVHISSAANEQYKVTAEIDNNIHNITEFLRKTSTITQDAANAAEKTASLTNQLEELIKQFKV